MTYTLVRNGPLIDGSGSQPIPNGAVLIEDNLNKVGTLEAGKLADITVSRADPLADIRSLENVNNIILVIKDGQTVKDIRLS